MKTKELIKLLQEADPTGEEHVVVGNVDISGVYKEPAYWDGTAQKIIRDEKGTPIGGKYCREGCKIQVDTLDFNTLIWDRTELPIDYSELDPDRQISYKENHDKIRTAARNVDYELELENFTKWVLKEAENLIDDKDNAKNVAKKFFDANLTPYDKIPPDIPIIGQSYNSRRHIQWSQQLELGYSENGFSIKRKEN